jgi:hypothetical protein
MARDSAPPPTDEPEDTEAAGVDLDALGFVADEPEDTVDARAGDAELVTAIAAAMAEAGEVTKSSRNTEQNYSYASAESILEATRGPLLRRGVLLIQRPRDWTVEEVRSRSGTAGTAITLELDFEFTNGRSTFTIERWRGQGQDYGDKAYGKAYTNAVKTFIRAQWLLPTGDDPEAAPSGEWVAKDAPAPAPAPPAWTRAATAEERAKVIPILRALLGDDVEQADEATARRYGAALAQACGGFPIAVVEWLSVLPEWAEVAANARRGAQDAAAEEPDTPAPEPDLDGPLTDEEAAKLGAVPDEPEPSGPDEAPRELADMTTEELLAELRAMGVDAPSSDKWSKAALINAVRHGRGGAAAGVPSDPPPAEDLDAEGKGRGGFPADTPEEEALRGEGCICPDPLALRVDDGVAEFEETCPVSGHGIPF